jgi:hypothetical protein
VNPLDVALYGEGYANYKARMQRELYCKEESEDDEVCDRKCSSDDEEDPTSRFM